MNDYGLTISAVFVPFSQSRNKAEKSPSLNWRVTLLKDGREVMGPFDYMQGCGHCPAYKNPSFFKPGGKRDQYNTDRRIREECESGKVVRSWSENIGVAIKTGPIPPPSATDVMYSLLADSSAADEGSFENWCHSLGFDTDSRKAERMYRECVDTFLKLRDQFTARSGFIPFYSNEPDDWAEKGSADMDHNEAGTVLLAYLASHSVDASEDDIIAHLSETDAFSSAIESAIDWDKLNAALAAMNEKVTA